MGADFISYLYKVTEARPDYSGPSPEEMKAFAQSSGCDEVEAKLLLEDAIATVRRALEEGSRESELRQIHGEQYLVTGGMSWGEEPTELGSALSRLDEAGILPRLGLEAPDEQAPTPNALSKRELATVLAALRMFQEELTASFKLRGWNPEHFAEFAPLTSEEIDALCERLNCGPREPEPDEGTGPQV
jgi:DNA-binding Xre family transcriptional regulator